MGVELEEVEGSEPTHLLFTSGKSSGGQIMLNKRELVIGRAPNCDVPIGDEFASSMHAKLVRVGDDWVLQDLNSTNGTFLDGKKVTTPAVVKLNVPIRVGNTSFELRS
jgi:pSer/pThr/pTyr-binding forkhead associated (FHA) protein